jgi:hypothetical protein
MSLLLALALLPFLADAAVAAPVSPYEAIIGAVVTIAGVVTAVLVRTGVMSLNVKRAIELAVVASGQGVRVASATYTERVKAANADGKLTDEEKAAARKAAFDATIAALGATGLKLVQAGFKDGWENAIETYVESAYAQQKDGAAPPS